MATFIVNGERHWKSIHQYTRNELKEWLDVLRNASGKEYQVNISKNNQVLNSYKISSLGLNIIFSHFVLNFQVQQKYEFTDNPSIQGMWNSFTNVDPSVATTQFPNVS